VSVFRGVDDVRPVVGGAETGAEIGAEGIGVDEKIVGLYDDWLVNILGHAGVMSGCSDW